MTEFELDDLMIECDWCSEMFPEDETVACGMADYCRGCADRLMVEDAE